MKAPILALFATPRADTPEAEGFLRLLAALVACGHPVRLVTTGPGSGGLEAAHTTEQGERLLAGIAAFGVVPEDRDVEEAARWAAEAPAILRLGDPARAGEPGLLEIGEGAPEAGGLLEAGAVIAARGVN